MLPLYCGVIMLIGSIYPAFQDMNVFSYVYKALVNYFQLKDGNSLVWTLGRDPSKKGSCLIFNRTYNYSPHNIYSGPYYK